MTTKDDDLVLPKYSKLFINGEWVDSVSGKTFNVINPITEKVLASVAEGNGVWNYAAHSLC